MQAFCMTSSMVFKISNSSFSFMKAGRMLANHCTFFFFIEIGGIPQQVRKLSYEFINGLSSHFQIMELFFFFVINRSVKYLSLKWFWNCSQVTYCSSIPRIALVSSHHKVDFPCNWYTHNLSFKLSSYSYIWKYLFMLINQASTDSSASPSYLGGLISFIPLVIIILAFLVPYL